MEVWKDIVGFEGLYRVSNMGNVISLHGRGEPEKALALIRNNDGYIVANLYKQGRLSRKGVHRLILEAFVGPCPKGMEGCHNDGDRTNNALSNLRWDTKKSNHADKVKHGTVMTGEKNPACTVTEATVRAIKARLKDGGHGIVTKVANEFGLKRSLVSDIKSGRSWASVS